VLLLLCIVEGGLFDRGAARSPWAAGPDGRPLVLAPALRAVSVGRGR